MKYSRLSWPAKGPVSKHQKRAKKQNSGCLENAASYI